MKQQWFIITTIISLWVTWTTQAKADNPFEYISPRPDAELVNAHTTIAIRHGDNINSDTITGNLFAVIGSENGLYPGEAILADDDKTVIFKPNSPFLPGEVVTVTVENDLKTTDDLQLKGTEFSFTVSPKSLANTRKRVFLTETITSHHLHQPHQIITKPYKTVPNDFPNITVTYPATEEVDEGYLFLTNFKPIPPLTRTQSYLLILDNLGEPVFYKRQQPNAPMYDFKKQANGLTSYFIRDKNNDTFYIMDDSYTVVDTYQAGNGYIADHHGLQLLDNGHALVMMYDSQRIDMRDVITGGYENAIVLGAVIQELDPSRNVIFEWRSWDHFKITDSNRELTSQYIDYVHINSIERDHDGHLLISSRHLDEVTKINRDTAEVIWRWGGGKQNQFTFIDDSENGFFRQHDARRVDNGNITLFDNRLGQQPPYSRVVEYQLDEIKKTATLVWQYRNTPDTYSRSMANAQRLPNGNTLIGWGGSPFPTLTEVTPDGRKIFELALDVGDNVVSYRSFRFPWKGYPTKPPTLVAITDTATTTLYYSWNGATEVISYNVYVGRTPTPTLLIDTQLKSGFETKSVITNLANGLHYFRVLPVTNPGVRQRYSNIISVTIENGSPPTFSNHPETGTPLIAPQPNAVITTTQPMFEWIKAISSDVLLTYTLTITPERLSASALLTTPIRFTTTQASYTPTQSFPNGTYVWTVSAQDFSGTMSESISPQKFILNSLRHHYLPVLVK